MSESMPSLAGKQPKIRLSEQYGLDLAYRKKVGQALVKCLEMPAGMTVVAAAVAAIKIDELQLKYEEFQDKVERLDNGKPTDIISNTHELTMRLQQLAGGVAGPVQGARELDAASDREAVRVIVPAQPVFQAEEPVGEGVE